MSPEPKKHQILFVSLEHWDNVWRRNQIICGQLLERHPDAEILWIGPPTDLWNRQGISSINAPLAQIFQPEKSLPRLFALKPIKPLPNVIGKKLNDFLFTSCLARAIKKLGWQNHITWVNNQSYCHLLPTSASTKLLYDITDDWTRASVPPRILEQIKQDDAWMLEHADHVIVCSQDLYRNKQQFCKNIHLIHNGVKIRTYLPESLAATEVSKGIQFANPVAGYIGTLHEDRLDVNLVVDVANKVPNVEFVFVGPNCLSSTSTKSLKDLSNCHILGSKPYAELPSFLAGFNVCIAPHVVTPFTESLDPIKMYEYMATGKPIVSTACAGFRDLRGLIWIAEDSNQFAEGITDAINKGAEKANERVDWAENQTWDHRVDEIEQLLDWTTAVTSN